jgi:cell division protein FtsB
MKLLHYIVELPLVIFAIWGIYNVKIMDEGLVLSLWPFERVIKVNTLPMLATFIVFGYLWGRINAWFKYAPLRRDLRLQRKTNRVLNKEHEKLNETVTGLKQDIQGLQEQAKANLSDYSDEPKKNWFSSIKDRFNSKKGN